MSRDLPQPGGSLLVAYGDREMFGVFLDLPGIDPKFIDLDAERNAPWASGSG